LVDSIPGAKVYASDIALTMLLKAREKHGNSFGLAAGDCCCLPFREGVFDTVGSSLALQWAQGLELAFSEAARVLKPGGLFVFSTLGPSTLWELRDCYKAHRAIEFKDRASVELCLKASGLEAVSIETRVIKRRYNSFIELLKALKNIGAAPPMECGKGLSPGKQLREAGKRYGELFPSPQGGIEASYELILGVARKV
ncbi:MAG: methyltransferase domain-containing protein, partial [Deltaproteobacteria bacterium]|nr:methyltransferase domain-containing protein [Deltaproteobacteria bacterium]